MYNIGKNYLFMLLGFSVFVCSVTHYLLVNIVLAIKYKPDYQKIKSLCISYYSKNRAQLLNYTYIIPSA
jgi:hypothetical protein